MLIPLVFIAAVVTNGKRPLWAMVTGATIALLCLVVFIRSATSFIAVAGDELRARGALTRAVRCRVGEIQRLVLYNDYVVFGMTRPWQLDVQLSDGQRKTLNADMKRFDWMDVFRLAERLDRPCSGSAMPYLAFVACASRSLASQKGNPNSAKAWSSVEKLRAQRATGKLILVDGRDERWIYLVRGRYLRLEDSWPKDLTPGFLRPADRLYEFRPSALSEDELSVVSHVLDDRWLGTLPGPDVAAQASG